MIFRIQPKLQLLQAFLLWPLDSERLGGVTHAADRPFSRFLHRPEQAGTCAKQRLRDRQIVRQR